MTLSLNDAEVALLHGLISEYERLAHSRRDGLTVFLSLQRKVRQLGEMAAELGTPLPPHARHERSLVTVEEAAALVKFSRRTIYNWINQGRVDVVRLPDGRVRIYEDSLWTQREVPQ